MTAEELRVSYLTHALTQSLADPTAFYDAFEEGDDAMLGFFTSLWEAQLSAAGEDLSMHPFFPQTEVYILEDTPEGFCALVTLTLQKTKQAPDMTAALVFGSAMDPRVFAGVPVQLKKGSTWRVVECREADEVEVGVLYQGCDNGMQLFDAPSPQRVDRDMPLMASRRPDAFVNAVVCWCLEHD